MSRNFWKRIKKSPPTALARKIKKKIQKILGSPPISPPPPLTAKEKKKQQKARKRVKGLRRRLLNLGFTRRALAELHSLVEDEKNPYQRRLAARELVRWYANERNPAGARRCLELLPYALAGERDMNLLRKAAIMEAEALDQLGFVREAKAVLSRALDRETHADLFLAVANGESYLSQRLFWVNKALELHHILPITYDASSTALPFDCLQVATPGGGLPDLEEGQPKVTVIMPVYNAELMISTALDSVLAQTWANLEIFVVDDYSRDATVDIIASYMSRDSRVHLLTTVTNTGPYIARNLALQKATGEFVTCHDADDWSHPEKIARQVLHLLKNPSVVANTSPQARATSDLEFYRRGKYGIIIYRNISSFMFRRRPVMEEIGYWDGVRFSADSEYIRRVKKIFGDEAVKDIKTGPLSFQRQSSKSLTGNESFGAHGYYMGARKEYLDRQRYFHAKAENLYYPFPQSSRPFPVPEPMALVPGPQMEGYRPFDVILVADFRWREAAFVQEIKELQKMGLSTGLIQMSAYDFAPPHADILPEVREILDGDEVQILVYGEKVSCDVLLVKDPLLLEERQRFIPEVKAAAVHVLVQEPPPQDPPASDLVFPYDVKICRENLHHYFGQTGLWHPVTPRGRTALQTVFQDLTGMLMASVDWQDSGIPHLWRQRLQDILAGKHD